MTFAPPGSKHLPEVNLPHVRFGSDRRIAEVERIMQTVRVRTISIEDPAGYNENDILHYHQTVVNTIAVRTLAITVGSGIFDFGTRRTAVTETWDIPPIELAIKVLPGTSVIRAQLLAEDADWPCFHNGVSAALAISPDSKGIDSSWIVFNRPATLNPEHGGFLLGLGLNGHLRSLMAYHAFPYMEPRHEWTSCGLLLGLACSFAGSQDPLCTKVLSLHTHALLPLGSAELNASPVIQSSALLGLGLVHTGSRNLRMAEVALSEVGRSTLPGVNLFEGYQEAYSFSASMAFGLIMLGKGGAQSSEVDRRLLVKLRRCIFGDTTETSNAIDTTVTSPGATLALGLMYLKTGNREVADMLEIPQSPFEADHVRPDILMLRVLARSLIMWDVINASLSWIEAQLPMFLQKGHTDHRRTSSMEIASELAYFNIIAGACFAIGLKLAGTGSELAHNNLIFFFSVLSKASCSSSMTYEGKIRRHGARQCLNVVTLALAAVMSGTGELNVLRRFRISHGQEGAGVTYGTHMATHMAFGILFLGRGHYTLGNSNLAIAAMCISFFPRFQPSPSDNKAYPQAFRHLWALAAEPRCLMARDVDTKETIYLPLRTRIQGPQNNYTQRLISPTLIAPYELINQIMVDTPRYWAVGYDLTDPVDKEALVRKGTMYVKRKSAYLDYNTDPKGNRSMVITAGSISGFDTHYDLLAAAEPMSISSTDLQHLIKTHSGTPQLVAMVELFSTDSKFDKFIRNTLLECVSMDKPDLCGIYISMWLAIHGRDQLRTENMAQFSMIRDFYAPSIFTHFSMPTNDRKVGWIRPNFIISAYRKLSEITISDEAIQEYFSHEVWTPDIHIYLVKNHVPPLDFLRAVLQLVLQESIRAREDQAPMEVRVRNAARAYVEALQRLHDISEDAERGGVKIWKNESIELAVRTWQILE
jgi:anaphase-promoting complex subunit 1